MENLQKLAFISWVLDLFNLKLMCFSDLHLFVSDVAIRGHELPSYMKLVDIGLDYYWMLKL